MVHFVTMSLIILLLGQGAPVSVAAEGPSSEKTQDDTQGEKRGLKPRIQGLTLRVDGLACPFCAYGLEKKVQHLKGYELDSYSVKINRGEVSFRWKPDRPLDLVAVKETVDKAGYTLRGVRVTAVGKIVKEDGKYFLSLNPSFDQHFYLYEKSALERIKVEGRRKEGAGAVLTETSRKQLDLIMADGRLARVTGAVHAHEKKDASPAIDMQRLDILSPERPSGKSDERAGD